MFIVKTNVQKIGQWMSEHMPKEDFASLFYKLP